MFLNQLAVAIQLAVANRVCVFGPFQPFFACFRPGLAFLA
jgi:hypothetical protein